MPQSLNHVIVHYIFSTKDRQAFLTPEIGPRLHAYLATVCRDMKAEAYRVYGVSDHVHVLATLPRTVTKAEFVERMKKVSSKWIKDQDAGCIGFAWQRCYGAFSVSVSQMESVPATSICRKNTIGTVVFRRSTANSSGGMEFLLTNATCGIDASPA